MDEDAHARDPGSGGARVAGVEVAPPVTETQARALAALGLLAGDVSGLTGAWSRIEDTWAATVERARAELAPLRLHERVDGEWSFVETLRHLLFVTDAWIRIGIQGATEHHPLGLAPHFVPDPGVLGLDVNAAPGLDTVLDARRDRQRAVRAVLAGSTDRDLGEPCAGRLAGFTRRGALQVVVAEEVFHHGFAVRDLARLPR